MTEFPPRTRSVLDPIHGLIRLTPDEMRLVNHRLFRRLRDIKQNGLLYLVFPSATHTRFEHSLGVLYVAHGMLNSLSLNSAAGVSKGTVVPIDAAQSGVAVEFPGLDTEARAFLYRTTRFAALVHDLGHGPLSHAFDSFAPFRASLAAVLEDPELAALEPLRRVLLEWGKRKDKEATDVKNARVPHEVMSCVFFAKIAHDLGLEPALVQAVTSAILGDFDGHPICLSLDDSIAKQWVPLIHDLIASAPADADRMDYMERDSRSIGVTYGLFDRNRVLKSFLVYLDKHSAQPIYRLGIKRSGLQAIENLIQARYELFVQIYYHKTNRAVSRMLESIAVVAEQEMTLFPPEHSLKSLEETYLNLSDEYFLRMLRGLGFKAPEAIVAVANDLYHRRLWKRVLDSTTELDAERILQTLRREFPLESDSLKRDESKPKALKDLAGGARLMSRRDGKTYVATTGETGWEESPIIKSLVTADERSTRLYLDLSDSGNARPIRERALALASERDPE